MSFCSVQEGLNLAKFVLICFFLHLITSQCVICLQQTTLVQTFSLTYECCYASFPEKITGIFI